MRVSVLPNGLPVPGRTQHIASRCAGKRGAVGVVRWPDHPARHASHQHPRRHLRARPDHSPGRHDRACADPGAAKHDSADADDRARLDLGTVHRGAVANGDPVGQHNWGACVDVQAAQVLDVGLFADGDHVVVGAQHSAVPDACPASQPHAAHDDRTRGDPGVRVDLRTGVAERSDQADTVLFGHS
jgi:hypothetical protein